MHHELCPMALSHLYLLLSNVMNAITTPMIGNASTKLTQ